MSTTGQPQAHFRAEIEGLRAIAVLAVILSHAHVPGFEGGYLGVDIFFVISGYLITGVILRAMRAERFSLADFYIRRIRRIIPSLLVVIGLTLVPAMIFMVSENLQNFGQSVFASVTFSNNVLLYLTSAYWDQDATFKPLLHTWSLGVEEQFYVFYPFLLLAIARWPRSRTVLLGILIAASLASCEWLDVRASFYLLPGRAWQLLAGALIALHPLELGKAKALVPASGLALILLAIGAARPDEAMTAWPRLAVVLGALGLLAADARESSASRLLCWPPLVAIGGLSYTLYLWHQPLFAFLRLLSPQQPSLVAHLLMLPFIFGLAVLTTHLVERRFRDAQLVSRRSLLKKTIAGSALLALVGLGLHFSAGLPGRHAATAGLSATELDARLYNERIFRFATRDFPPDSDQRILLLGNSLARDFGNVLLEGGALRHQSLVYREDVTVCQDPGEARELLRSADVVIIEASSWQSGCFARLRPLMQADARVLILGPRQFGYSIEPFMGLSLPARRDIRVESLPGYAKWNLELARDVAPARYLDYYELLAGRQGVLPLFDETGRPLTVDRRHLTQPGACYIARLLGLRNEFSWLGLASPGEVCRANLDERPR